MKISKNKINEILYNAFEKAQADVGSTAFFEIIDSLHKDLSKYLGQSLPIDSVSGISLDQLKLQKDCYKKRKESNGKATAYGEAHTDEIREGVIDHLIALLNYR